MYGYNLLTSLPFWTDLNSHFFIYTKCQYIQNFKVKRGILARVVCLVEIGISMTLGSCKWKQSLRIMCRVRRTSERQRQRRTRHGVEMQGLLPLKPLGALRSYPRIPIKVPTCRFGSDQPWWFLWLYFALGILGSLISINSFLSPLVGGEIGSYN